MGQDRAAAAIERVEQALARIEAAAGRREGGSGGDDRQLGEVREAYRTLRGRVEQAVGEIDRLLAAAEAG